MTDDVAAATIIRLRQSRRVQELRCARRKLDASGVTALWRNPNQDLRRSPMTGDHHRSVPGLLRDHGSRAQQESCVACERGDHQNRRRRGYVIHDFMLIAH